MLALATNGATQNKKRVLIHDITQLLLGLDTFSTRDGDYAAGAAPVVAVAAAAEIQSQTNAFDTLQAELAELQGQMQTLDNPLDGFVTLGGWSTSRLDGLAE